MKTIIKYSLPFIILLLCEIILFSCKKESQEIQNNVNVSDKGEVVFWVSEDIGYMTVFVDGIDVGKIKGFYDDGIPGCGDNNCITVTLKGGSHNYKASCNSGTFSKTFTVVSNTCNKVKIY